jgi:hypothetical protein
MLTCLLKITYYLEGRNKSSSYIVEKLYIWMIKVDITTKVTPRRIHHLYSIPARMHNLNLTSKKHLTNLECAIKISGELYA